MVRDLGERRFHLERIAEIRRCHPNSKVHTNLLLAGYRKELIELGERTTLCEGTVLAFGDHQNGFGRIRIGAQTWIGQYNNLRSGGGDIIIGSDCLVSQFCSLIASNHGVEKELPIRQQPPSEKAGIVVENDVWLGAGVSILPGVRVSQGAVIGAGSVVTRDIPAYEIWAGVPAVKMGQRN